MVDGVIKCWRVVEVADGVTNPFVTADSRSKDSSKQLCFIIVVQYLAALRNCFASIVIQAESFISLAVKILTSEAST